MLRFSIRTTHRIRAGTLPLELLGEPDEDAFGPADVAEPVHVAVADHFADEVQVTAETYT